jgi:hypothetical protein
MFLSTVAVNLMKIDQITRQHCQLKDIPSLIHPNAKIHDTFVSKLVVNITNETLYSASFNVLYTPSYTNILPHFTAMPVPNCIPCSLQRYLILSRVCPPLFSVLSYFVSCYYPNYVVPPWMACCFIFKTALPLIMRF